MEPFSTLETDIVVAGGGPAGVAAAISAARGGAKVILIERYGFLGGMATAGYVFPFMTHYAGDRPVIGGIWQEMIDALRNYPHGFKESTHLGLRHFCFDVEGLKQIWLDFCREAGVTLQLHSWISDVIMSDYQLQGVITHSKSGCQHVKAKIIIDATGDGDVAARAGAPYESGRSSDGRMQPLSLHYRMANVDVSRMPTRSEINLLYATDKAAGLFNNPRENLLWFDTNYPDQIHFNSTRIINMDGTNRDDLTAAELEGRRQMMEQVQWLRSRIPGFEKSFLLTSAAQVGVRESRRIIGEHMITEAELLSEIKFPDAIAFSAYPVDIHNPTGSGTVIKQLPYGAFYSIPFRALLPRGIKQLLVAGRPISATHEAHAATRIQAVASATGQAAGIAATIAWQQNISPEEIKYTELRAELMRQGAIVEIK